MTKNPGDISRAEPPGGARPAADPAELSSEKHQLQETAHRHAKEPQSKVVDNARLRRWSAPILGVFTTIIVALFLQKSADQSAAETLLWLLLAALGMFLASLLVLGIRFRGYSHSNSLKWPLSRPLVLIPSGVVGLALLVIAFTGVSRNTNSLASESMPEQTSFDSESVALRDLQYAQSDTRMRVAVTVFNKRKSALSLNSAQFEYSTKSRELLACGPENEPSYSVSDHVSANNGQVGPTSVAPESGPFAGYSIPAQGRVTLGCGSDDLIVDFPVTVNLPSQGVTTFTVELPKTINLLTPQREPGGPAQYTLQAHIAVPPPGNTSCSLRIELGYGADPKATITDLAVP